LAGLNPSGSRFIQESHAHKDALRNRYSAPIAANLEEDVPHGVSFTRSPTEFFARSD
jgi:hypothetical protein